MCQRLHCRADLLRFTVFRTDKGSLDKGGLPQPAFLNFHAKLLYPPAHPIQVRTPLGQLELIMLLRFPVVLPLCWSRSFATHRMQDLCKG